jgi:hypothetical protein
MKTRITNLLTATLWLLIFAVWIPTFWVLVQLPGTWDGSNDSSLLNYVEEDLETVSYRINEICTSERSPVDNWLLQDDEDPPVCSTLSTEIYDLFIPLIVFTLLVLGGQYLLTGKVRLRFTKEQEADDP